LTQIKNSP